MFGRRKTAEILPPVPADAAIDAAEGKPISVVEGGENDPMQLAVVKAQYLVEHSGEDFLVRERIDGATVSDDESSITVGRMNQNLGEVADEMTEELLPGEEEAGRGGKFVVEYPRKNPEDPTLGFVVTPGATTRYYDFVETQDSGIEMTDRRDATSWKETFKLPRGSRVTTSVKLRLAAEELPAENAAAGSYEADFTERVQQAINAYDEEYSEA